MAGHLCKRALIALLTIFIIITLSFLMVRFMPGDPLIHLVGEENYYYMKEFNPQELERLAEKYAMSGTLGQQYGNYLSSILSKLDLRDRTQLAIWAVQTGVAGRPFGGPQ